MIYFATVLSFKKEGGGDYLTQPALIYNQHLITKGFGSAPTYDQDLIAKSCGSALTYAHGPN